MFSKSILLFFLFVTAGIFCQARDICGPGLKTLTNFNRPGAQVSAGNPKGIPPVGVPKKTLLKARLINFTQKLVGTFAEDPDPQTAEIFFKAGQASHTVVRVVSHHSAQSAAQAYSDNTHLGTVERVEAMLDSLHNSREQQERAKAENGARIFTLG